MVMYKDLYNIDLPDFPISAHQVDQVSDAMEQSISFGIWKRVEDGYKKGDILAMALCPRSLRAINHVGFYLGGDQFIHIILNQRSAICRLSDFPWKNRIKGAYRWQA